MTIESLQNLSLVSFIVAGVLLLISVALFFLLDVPKLYGDISGQTAKKAIEKIREQNESTGNKAYKPSAVNEARGKLTDKISPSGRLIAATNGLGVAVGTEKFSTVDLAPTDNETAVLESIAARETTVLAANVSAGETAVLSCNQNVPISFDKEEVAFTVDVEMSFTGSSEIIE